MFHLAAFSAANDSTANTDTAALADGILTIQNNHFLLPSNLLLLGAYLQSATITRGKLQSPKILQYNPLYIRPVNTGATPSSRTQIMDLSQRPLELRGQEELSLLSTNAVAMGTERVTGLIWLAPDIEPVPQGDVYDVRLTSTTALVSNTWTQLAYTIEQALPDGLYAMVYSEIVSTNAIAHRWTFTDQYWRPGFLSLAAEGNFPYLGFMNYNFGKMGEFRTYNLPRLEGLGSGTDASHVGYMRVVRVGGAGL